MISIQGSERQLKVWEVLLDLAERAGDWVVIGARMVELHAWEHGAKLARTSFDGDALADARVRPNPVRKMAELLVSDGFDVTHIGGLGTGHTFEKDGVEIDVLAPDNLGRKSEEARTTIPPLHTVEVPGGRQALDRREWVDVRVGSRKGRLPRPSLLGAILIKARAVDVDDVPDDQRRDLALLLSLVEDPETVATNLRGQERSWLRNREDMDDAEAGCWADLSDDQVQRGLSALRILAALEIR